MENWLIRIVALFCAVGAAGLLWTFGVFVVVPWREGRLFSLNSAELQILGASLLLGLAAAWGALHVFALADRAGPAHALPGPRRPRRSRRQSAAACRP